MNQYPDFDQKLYDDLRRGKEYAFAAVFERYNRLLYTIAYRFEIRRRGGRCDSVSFYEIVGAADKF